MDATVAARYCQRFLLDDASMRTSCADVSAIFTGLPHALPSLQLRDLLLRCTENENRLLLWTPEAHEAFSGTNPLSRGIANSNLKETNMERRRQERRSPDFQSEPTDLELEGTTVLLGAALAAALISTLVWLTS